MLLEEHLARQKAWSENTFGPGDRTYGVLNHIQKEIIEVLDEESGDRLPEWIDIIILAFDGAWRDGHSPMEIVEALQDKQTENENREWPDWRKFSQDHAIEHIRDHIEEVKERDPGP